MFSDAYHEKCQLHVTCDPGFFKSRCFVHVTYSVLSRWRLQGLTGPQRRSPQGRSIAHQCTCATHAPQTASQLLLHGGCRQTDTIIHLTSRLLSTLMYHCHRPHSIFHKLTLYPPTERLDAGPGCRRGKTPTCPSQNKKSRQLLKIH